jgi:hypothetical protein
MALIFPDPDAPPPQVVNRHCPVCDWQGMVIAGTPGEDDCPQCHAPTVMEPSERGKNPHAAALGRLGGVLGGKARAKALSPKRRKEIARNAALARWRKH